MASRCNGTVSIIVNSASPKPTGFGLFYMVPKPVFKLSFHYSLTFHRHHGEQLKFCVGSGGKWSEEQRFRALQ
jgi:hypothetical protein